MVKPARNPEGHALWRACCRPLFFVLLLSLLLSACGPRQGDSQDGAVALPPLQGAPGIQLTDTPITEASMPPVPLVYLTLTEKDVAIEPLPLRAGFPFTVTALIHNQGDVPAVGVPVVMHISAQQEEIGYVSFLQTLTITVPASQTLPVKVPVDWNFSGGEHQLWMQVNRLPKVWQSDFSTQPEADISDNIALAELMVEPFDAYASNLCPGRVDVEIGPSDVLPEPEQQRVLVRVHNLGNRAMYNLPVIVIGDGLTGVNYTPIIPPCGGTADIAVALDRPIQQGESLAVHVNPSEWASSIPEDDLDNNQVAVAAGLAPGMEILPDAGPDDYDFAIHTSDIETPEPWIVFVTVHNLGTRDAALVPIRVENEAGRKIADAIPLIQGDGLGVAAIRVGYLWVPGGTLTFTINPMDAEDAYPESNRDNNVATFTLP